MTVTKYLKNELILTNYIMRSLFHKKIKKNNNNNNFYYGFIRCRPFSNPPFFSNLGCSCKCWLTGVIPFQKLSFYHPV